MNEISERQRFDQVWLWIILLLINTLLIFKTIESNFINSYLIISIIVIIVSLFIYNIQLYYVINCNEIKITFFPFFKNKIILLEDLDKISIVKYNPLLNYGGWGIRQSSKGIAYTTKGNFGILLEYKNGKEILIGSQISYKILNDFLEKIEKEKPNLKIIKFI